VESPSVQAWLDAAARLPSIEPRTIYVVKGGGGAATAEAYASLGESEKANYTESTLDERFYYLTRYGTPIAYARALDLAVGAENRAAPDQLSRWRILDFGYGGIGHLRMLASIGADAVGVEVDPMLQALYSRPGDTGAIENPTSRRRGSEGKLTLVHGRWPADAGAAAQVGGGYDLIISKNVLKRGYIHPEQEVDKRMLVDLGVDDETFLRALFGALKPGGRALIYNLSPKPAAEGQPYRPWADGRCPFDRAALEKAGFRVIEFEKDDSEAARRMGSLIGWDRGDRPMDLQHDLFAQYTLLERPMRARSN
ncbi:MAG: hypothetical protein IBJ10_03905, partial [Phycisphaerales bacterium]|nr:hypothetical protein [Phycisphaerales bacterium]